MTGRLIPHVGRNVQMNDFLRSCGTRSPVSPGNLAGLATRRLAERGTSGARAHHRVLPQSGQLSWSLTSGGRSWVGRGDESITGAVRATRAWNVYQHARSPRSIDQGGSGHSGSANGSGPSSLTGRKEYRCGPWARVIARRSPQGIGSRLPSQAPSSALRLRCRKSRSVAFSVRAIAASYALAASALRPRRRSRSARTAWNMR